MKKIMFNDKFDLTQAVLDGRKTMTRRIIEIDECVRFPIIRFRPLEDWEKKVVNPNYVFNGHVYAVYNELDLLYHLVKPRYEIGEVVAIAQSYKNIDNYYNAALYRKTSIHGQIVDDLDLVSFQDIRRWKYFSGDLMNTSGWTNKMFVKADLMPHHIKITGIKVERLQNISDEDCLKEGIIKGKCGSESTHFMDAYYVPKEKQPYCTPRNAFEVLINKVSGKGTWESNPFVFAYEFVLFD